MKGIAEPPTSGPRGGGGSPPGGAKGIPLADGGAATFDSVLCRRNPNVGACWREAAGGGGGGTPGVIGATVPGSFFSRGVPAPTSGTIGSVPAARVMNGVPATDERVGGAATGPSGGGGIAPGRSGGRAASGPSAVSVIHPLSGSTVCSSVIVAGTRGGGATSGSAAGGTDGAAGTSDLPARRKAPSRGPFGTSGGIAGSGVAGALRSEVALTPGAETLPGGAISPAGNGASPRTLANVSSSSNPPSCAACASGGCVGSSSNGSADDAGASPSTAIVSWMLLTPWIHAGRLAEGATSAVTITQP